MWELIQWLSHKSRIGNSVFVCWGFLIISQDSYCQVLFLRKEGNPMVSRRLSTKYMVLPHFGAKSDMDSRELVKLDSDTHCCFSWDAPNLRSLFSLPSKLFPAMPPHIPKTKQG